MCLIRNSSNYPQVFASYQLDKTSFGTTGSPVYPGECRYVNATKFKEDKIIISVFTPGAHVPGNFVVTTNIDIPKCPIGFTLTQVDAEAIISVIVGKHSFFELKYDDQSNLIFVENETLSQQDCRVCHGS